MHISSLNHAEQDRVREDTLIFYREDRVLANELLNLMPRPTEKVYLVRNQNLDSADVEIYVGELQIPDYFLDDVRVRVLGSTQATGFGVLQNLFDTVPYEVTWDTDQIWKLGDLADFDTDFLVILYDDNYYVQAKQLQNKLPESLILYKNFDPFFERFEEEIIMILMTSFTS